MTLQTVTPQMHLIYEAIDALVTATRDEKADLRFADWDEAEITPTSVGLVVVARLMALRSERELNARISNVLDLMGLCSGADALRPWVSAQKSQACRNCGSDPHTPTCTIGDPVGAPDPAVMEALKASLNQRRRS